jgi:methionyl-tRNA formyltransferase
MRIVVHGQEAFGKAVLEKLLDRGENVVAVFCAPDKEGKPRDPLGVFASEKGLPVHQPKSWKTPEALQLMQSFEADLCVMAYVLLFVPQPVITAPKFGSIQYHPSLLPMHRGPSSINWPIAQGATKTGLTIFYPNDGLDEGDILLQKECDIDPDETIGDVYFKKLFPMGIDAMVEAIELVREGKAPRIVQDLSKGSYESWFKKDVAQIDWSKPMSEVYNLIRAGNPAPGAWTSFRGVKVDVYDSARATGAGVPGEVLALSPDGIKASAVNGAVLIKRVRTAGGPKITAFEYANTVGLNVGDRFDPFAAASPKA